MATFELINSEKSEIVPTKSFVKDILGTIFIVLDKDHGDAITVRGKRSDVRLSKVKIKSDFVVSNGRRIITVPCDKMPIDLTLLPPTTDINLKYFSRPTVYKCNSTEFYKSIGRLNYYLLFDGAKKLALIN